MKGRKLKKAVAVGTVALMVVAGIGGCKQNEQKPVETVAETIENVPVITAKNKKIVAGVNTEIKLQDVIKEIEVDGKLKEVKVEMKDAKMKDILTVADIKDGKAVKNVPAKSLKFSKGGVYEVVISVADENGEKAVLDIKFDIGKELLSYVKGIKDWTVEVGSENVDFMKDVTFDSSRIKGIRSDFSKVDLTKVGEYEGTYFIKDMNGKEIAKEVIVRVVSKEEAQTEADRGNVVETSNNEVKNDSQGNKPSGGTSSGNNNNPVNGPENKPSVPDGGDNNHVPDTEPSNPSGGNGNNTKPPVVDNGNNNTKPPVVNPPETKPPVVAPPETEAPPVDTTPPATNPPETTPPETEPPHTHTWEDMTEDQGWYEAQYDISYTYSCNGCQEEFLDVYSFYSHTDSFDMNDPHCVAGYTDIPHQEFLGDKWISNIVVIGQKCSGCGATK